MPTISDRPLQTENAKAAGPAGPSPHPVPRSVAEQLAADLRRHTTAEVRFGAGDRALYATDASNYRQTPVGIVIPRTTDDIVQTVRLCRQYGAPVLPRGGGTSLAGQCCNVAVVIDTSKYVNRVLEVDAGKRLARVECGIVLDALQAAVRSAQLVFGPDPSTHSHCTIGGMIGNDSCGVHSVLSQFYGPGVRTSDNVEEMEVLTYDGARMTVGRTPERELQRIIREGGRQGEIYDRLRSFRDKYASLIRSRFPAIPRRVSGYNLTEILPENGFNVAGALAGSEGTLALVLEAVVRLTPQPRTRSLLVLGYPDVFEAADHISEILRCRPIGLEGMDDLLVKDIQDAGLAHGALQDLPEGRGWLLVEFGGETKEESDARAHELIDDLLRDPHPPAMKLFDDPDQEKKIWSVRESGLGATAHVAGKRPTWEGWEDAAVPPERLGHYLRAFRKLLDRYGYIGDLYGHFGQGCVHTRIDFDLQTSDGIRRFRAFVDEAADLVVSHGGSLSGEHGDGQSRGELLYKMFGAELVDAFREFKSIWDPQWKMNPGKVVDAYRIDENLRLGTSYHPHDVRTHFRFPAEGGSFAKATLRCVGVGECRKMDAGTMCPSYMVTREEEHSTRGRARLLFEMLQGETLKDGWRDKSVKEALDLCLACKGCKGECPVHVDMATYKAEFLAHHYARRLRPRAAYAFGLIYWWARLAQHVPRAVNALMHMPAVSGAAKVAAGMAHEREFPTFAVEPFTRWFGARSRPGSTEVMLWPDTFTNYFHPEVGIAATEVLESLGYSVIIPHRSFCCGRPLYDYGMLGLARRQLRTILEMLEKPIQRGIPIVGLEPSCIAVFRDELPNLFPNDVNATRLAQQSFLLPEFLERRGDTARLPKIHGEILLHGHCHHKAILDFDCETRLMRALALTGTPRVVDGGCCGMAGSFGFEKRHYKISKQIGERVLLPAVRRAPSDTILVADGFSCREQIRQLTGRRAVHIAEVLAEAIRSAKQA